MQAGCALVTGFRGEHIGGRDRLPFRPVLLEVHRGYQDVFRSIADSGEEDIERIPATQQGRVPNASRVGSIAEEALLQGELAEGVLGTSYSA